MNLADRIAEHLHYLSAVLGPRPSGSANNRAAETYISSQFAAWGYRLETQPFPCPNWTCRAAELEQEGQSLPVLANPYTPSCDVTANLALAATLAELETVDLEGKIALLYGDLSRQPLACKSWFLKEDRDIRIIELLEQKRPAAVLMAQAAPGSISRLIEDQEFLIPSATLPAASARQLISHSGSPVYLRLDTAQKPAITANVIARRPGSRRETLLACAHYDTKVDTPGAGDNAAGVAALLGLAEILSEIPLEAGLEFVAFTNEEYLPIGDDAYLAAVGEAHLQELLLAVNFDGLGHILDSNTLAIFSASPALQQIVESIQRAYPAVQWVEPWPESNHSTFAWRGVPALALSSAALRISAHQLEDTEDWISPSRVAEGARLVAEIFQALQSAPVADLRLEASERQ